MVTMKWWDDLWLNEGFASFVEFLGVDRIFPEWNMMDQFVLSKTQSALRTDALSTSHPISLAVTDPVDIESIFDAISYNKVLLCWLSVPFLLCRFVRLVAAEAFFLASAAALESRM